MATFTNTQKSSDPSFTEGAETGTVTLTGGLAMGALGLTYAGDIVNYATMTPVSKSSNTFTNQNKT